VLAGIIMFESAFRVVSDGMAGVVIACQRCEWRGHYETEFTDPREGTIAHGEPYSDSELLHMRALEALEEAVHDHRDHATGPTFVPAY